MRSYVASRFVPTRILPAALVVSLIGALIALAPVAPQPAEAGSDYNAVVDLTFPVDGSTTYRDTFYAGRDGGARSHRATDIMASHGVSIHAAVGGTVTYIPGIDGTPLKSSGWMIKIAGDDGRDYWYIHLGPKGGSPSDAYAPGIRKGVRVERGQLIGYNGCSGNASCSAPHLHFEIHDDGVSDPSAKAGDSPRMNPYPSLRAAQARGDVPSAAMGGSGLFWDVRGSNTHFADIEWLAEQGVTKGCNPPTNSKFCPGQAVSREQMAAFIVRARNLTKTSGIRFKDVPKGSTFERDIDRLATAGVTKGCNPPKNDRFCPDDPVSREQMAAFMSRAYNLSAAKASFSDVGSGSKFAGDISRLAGAGVTKGCNPPSNTRFCPKDPVTRAQMASFIRRAD